MKNRLIGLAAALTVAVGASLTVAAPAQAATPAIQVTKVYYNSPGTDNRTNTSLNAAGTTIDTCSWGSSGSYTYC
ncbi:hypothetical protein CS0771_11460 [Catellatospora sp. IY07-71]|uniref:hypothetical protein n=1 Tax=Catellatospora sp. IY07-71 TaxID=2728827 RepID=UPI001BB305CE|nr:hypothetical protein [Catellatospora sp. IY07-71]BCJ71602.1 hypothetical protein CS0771_11460 [Catellatospora sp. IY07-71]